MWKGAVVVLLQEVLIRKRTIQSQARSQTYFPEYECYIAVRGPKVRWETRRVGYSSINNCIIILYRSGMPRGCRKGGKCQNTNSGIWMQQSANHSSHVSTQTSFSIQHQHSLCTSSYGESTWFAVASHPPSQNNNRRSANTWEAPSTRYSLAMSRWSLQAHYMIRWSIFSSTSCY